MWSCNRRTKRRLSSCVGKMAGCRRSSRGTTPAWICLKSASLCHCTRSTRTRDCPKCHAMEARCDPCPAPITGRAVGRHRHRCGLFDNRRAWRTAQLPKGLLFADFEIERSNHNSTALLRIKFDHTAVAIKPHKTAAKHISSPVTK